MKLADIGEISEKTGIAASTLRYYDELGLITSVARHGLRRQFPPETWTQLSVIALGQQAGFSLREIKQAFAPPRPGGFSRALLRRRAGQIDKQIKDLMALQRMLLHVAECRAPSHFECPRFQQLMRAAARRRKRDGHHLK